MNYIVFLLSLSLGLNIPKADIFKSQGYFTIEIAEENFKQRYEAFFHVQKHKEAKDFYRFIVENDKKNELSGCVIGIPNIARGTHKIIYKKKNHGEGAKQLFIDEFLDFPSDTDEVSGTITIKKIQEQKITGSFDISGKIRLIREIPIFGGYSNKMVIVRVRGKFKNAPYEIVSKEDK